MKKGLVSIIILNWNGKELIKDCIESIKEKTSYPKYEIIVVDNGSKDNSVEMLKKMKKEKIIDKLILNKKNMGFAYANNQGFETAEGEYFFMLNNDTKVTKNWLTKLVKAIETDEKIAAVGAQLLEPSILSKKLENGLIEKQTVCGAAMLMRKKVIDLIGNLDAEEFSPIYGEETDWNYRARASGFKIIEAPVKIIHLGSVNTTEQTGKEWQYELINTHRLKAMLFNLNLFEFLHHVPGLGLIFIRSIPFKTPLLIKSYLNNLLNLKKILQKRKERKIIARKIKMNIKANNK